MSQLRAAVVLTVLFTLLTGIAYPLAITAIGQTVFPFQANGSLAKRGGQVIGSELIGQNFKDDRYFHGRPSATTAADPSDPSDPAKSVDAPYNAANSAGSNLAPSSKALLAAVEARAKALGGGAQPADLVTASASGLDPHLSPAGAMAQVARVARARGLPEGEIGALVDRHIEGRALGVLGQPHVSVLALNLALDALKP